MIGNFNGHIDGKIKGILNGEFIGTINNEEYEGGEQIDLSEQLTNMDGTFIGHIDAFGLQGNVEGQFDGRVISPTYTGTYTYPLTVVKKKIITDPSNVPYQLITYSQINSVGVR